MDRHQFLPGGYSRSALAVGAVVPVAIRAEGAEIWTEDGRRLLDFNNNFASLIHGHSNPLIVGSAVKAVAGGASFGVSNELELLHAATFLERLPHADQVRYTNSGTEAVMSAVRLARAATGRSKCVVIDGSYHGTADVVLPALGKDAHRGVPGAVVAETVTIPINDLERLEEVMDGGDPPAALLVDLLPNRLDLTPVSAEFIGRARDLCTELGTLLIVDEVISFRLAWSGLAGELGVRPDITVTGKLIGGGFPVGAVAGPEPLMSELNPLRPGALLHGGTFASNPVTMAAGRAALELLTGAEIDRINSLGDEFGERVGREVGGLGWNVTGRGSLVRVVPLDLEADEPYRDLWWAAFNRGVLVTPSGLLTLSTAMDEDHVSFAAERLVEAMTEVATAKVRHEPWAAPTGGKV